MIETTIFLLTHTSFLLGIGMMAMVVWKSRPSPIRKAFLITIGLMNLWNLGTLLEIDFQKTTIADTFLFIDICYIGICLMPVALLYLGKVIRQPDWRPRPRHALFLLVPLVSVAMVFTNALHHQFFIHFSLYSSEAIYGAYYYFHSLYSYGCILAGVILMIISSIRNFGIFSMQSLLVIAGIATTAVPNILFSFGIGHLHFNISTVAFTASIFCFLYAFLKYGFTISLPFTMKQVVDLISDGYLIIDTRHCIVTYNRPLLTMFSDPININLGDTIRTFVERCFVNTSFDYFLDLTTKAIAQQRTISFEQQIFGGIYVNTEITPIIQRNTYLGSIILFKDITKSKQLIEATQAASRAKSEFLSHMSHEIRTPLNAVIGMINIGLDTQDIEKKDYCLKRADSASKHLLGIINDILDMSKIEADKFELSYEDFDFEQMLMNITNVISIRAEEKQQNLIVHLDKNVPHYIHSDQLRLSQVIMNLLSNAIKFTPEQGTIALTIEKTDEVNGEVTLNIEVADNGIGISEEQQKHLFLSFSQADAGIAQKFGGTGLGLAIAKRIVELMGGTIGIESTLGEGSKFIFTIKAKERPCPAEITRKNESQISAGGGATEAKDCFDFSGHTLLIAEDLEINREILSAILKETHVSIDFAENGKVAVSMFEENADKYALILMDIQMPEMDGYTATATLRALDLPKAKQIPILAMTANVFREDIEKCTAVGMNGHTGKPIDPDALLGLLQKYLLGL